MLVTKVYKDEWEVNARLEQFQTNQEELRQVALLTLGARSDSVSDDPCTAPGLLSYIYGTRYLRQLFRAKDWVADSSNNIESVLNLKSGTRIIYQNVDRAGSFNGPKAISSKGAASCRMVDVAQGRLFTDIESPEVVPLSRVHAINSLVWYYCVSFDDDDFNAELSLPAAMEGGNFKGFVERIFIGNGSAPPPTKVGKGGEPPIEFEPIIARK